MAFKRLDKARLFVEVSGQLRQSIFKGDFRPGERLPSERELADQFGVSRIIVRQAIWDLKKSGLVEVKLGAYGGAFVQEMQHNAVTSVMQDVLTMGGARPADIIAIRLILEPSAAELAAQHATGKDIECLEKNLQSPPEKMTSEVIQWNIDFHRSVAKASHNPILGLLTNILLDFTENLLLGIFKTQGWDKVLHDDDSHPAILEKIVQKDTQGAKQLFYDHLLDIKPTFEDWERKFDTTCFGSERKN